MFKASRTSTWVIATIAVTIVLFILWSLWAELDQVTRAPGRVVPIGRVQIVQSADGGVISEIRVREGDKVTRGQLLVTLDKVKLQAAVTEARAKVASLQSAMVRIQAELYDRPLTFPAGLDGYPDFVRNQRELYFKRRAAQQSDLDALHSMKGLMRQELDLNMPLLKSGDVARSEIIRMQRGIADVDGQISGKQAKYIADLQTEYTKTDEDLVSAQQILAQREDSLKATDLIAPTNGIVKNVRLTTVGAVLRPGDEVLQIVPSGERLIIEAQVAPKDIAFVKVGQQASVKFDAYDSSVYGVGHGRVTFISPDTLSEQRPDGTSVTYFRVNLEADASRLRPRHPGEKIEIQPGMTATAEILTGKNTVFRYLTKPITKTTSESMSER
ncbi:HlyD family efflux transporter periplasmic adaptor subunit [Novosphingobium sp. G106]|uniref:HlyD family efflux transporter periplasmic adaptor subunit n=1 Tax=Novosphingobium sp. G106 TaxID=2849500 RepID=UPI001C2D6AA4|nr:HlyD family efflux transporter periplasmic adaptor subunit [Novosphingobium sp. G106]MBV1690028.1 HlyD family efflux transporter periplasmic adaptor subunit [Novosphingobium sp. G106]